MIEEIERLLELTKDIYLVLKGLENLEDGDKADYQGVIDDLEWNKHILNNRLIDLRRKKE